MNHTESFWNILKGEIHEVPITYKILFIERLIGVWFHSEKSKALCESLISGMS